MSRAKIRNLFLAFGIVAVVIMLLTFDMPYAELLDNLRRAGGYLPLILVLWAFVYLVNTLSWWVILRSSGSLGGLRFRTLYKYSVTGFALNSVTPVGLMGGEPYRIMELTPYVGVERATSSVILFVMMHIFSHFLFWLSSVVLFVLLHTVTPAVGVVLAFVVVFCLLLGQLFVKGYRHGMAVAVVNLGSKLPFLKRSVTRFAQTHHNQLADIDRQIALLHQQSKRSFYTSLLLEYLARVASCAEVWLILNILTDGVSFPDCILIVAFSSLLANLLFFMPMQVGGREGGFALAVGGLSLSGAYGVYVALLTRVRELVWVLIGLLFMKIGNKK